MSGQVVTVVSAVVDPLREADLTAAYEAVIGEDFLDGLLASALMRGSGDAWQIVTVWRDRAALEAMRASGEPPAAPRVFRQAGADPALAIFEVTAAILRKE